MSTSTARSSAASSRVSARSIAPSDRRRYVQHGVALELQTGDWSAPSWDLEGTGEHSVAAQQAVLDATLERGATALGAFDGERLVGIGVVLPHLRPGVAQLVALYVSDSHRGRGIGGRLSDELERIAREAGGRRWSSPRRRR